MSSENLLFYYECNDSLIWLLVVHLDTKVCNFSKEAYLTSAINANKR